MSIKMLKAFCLILITLFSLKLSAENSSLYNQEMSKRYFEDNNPLLNKISTIKINDNNIYALTENGIITLNNKTDKWVKVDNISNELKDSLSRMITGMLVNKNNDKLLASKNGLEKIFSNGKKQLLLNFPVKQLAKDSKNNIYAATINGIYKGTFNDEFKKLIIKDNVGRAWAFEDVRGVAVTPNDNIWIATPAGIISEVDGKYIFYTGKDGVPYMDFTCVTVATNGYIWFGTHFGAVFFDGKNWGYRQGKLWIPNDNVNCITADKNGAVWIGTDSGIAKIYFKKMDLAEKARKFEKDIRKIERTPFGYIAEGHLKNPGDKSKIEHSDSDNDGLWTSMYGAGECFAYAATGKEIYKKRADKVFKALKFLQDAPQATIKEHRPPEGYVARTVRSTDLPDPNIGRIERDQKKHDEVDKEWKVYEPRWPKTEDEKYFWKSDTSTDELDGHYFFYGLYYDLLCKNNEEKAKVRDVVRKLTDHLIKYNYTLMDFNGTRTRYADLSPNSLNQNLAWFAERGLKSLSMLSYLTVAEYVTRDKKYTDEINKLMNIHGYRANAMHYKMTFGFGSGNQSDDEMAFMNYYNIMHYSPNKELKETVVWSAFHAWRLEEPEMNPLFNYIYASFGIGATFTDAWGTINIDPWKGWKTDSLKTLESLPMDKIQWGQKNSQRTDIINLPKQQVGDVTEESTADLKERGYRVNGKVIPVENRSFHHWNTDPWRLDYGESGTSIRSGSTFLLPYYMGLYYKFL